MGMLAAIELAGKVEAGTMSLADAVRQHLTTGFVKPIREEWYSACVGVIERYKGGDDDLSYGVPIPNKPGAVPVSAESLVEDLHLEPFIGTIDE